jgi:hypothetical protein
MGCKSSKPSELGGGRLQSDSSKKRDRELTASWDRASYRGGEATPPSSEETQESAEPTEEEVMDAGFGDSEARQEMFARRRARSHRDLYSPDEYKQRPTLASNSFKRSTLNLQKQIDEQQAETYEQKHGVKYDMVARKTLNSCMSMLDVFTVIGVCPAPSTEGGVVMKPSVDEGEDVRQRPRGPEAQGKAKRGGR